MRKIKFGFTALIVLAAAFTSFGQSSFPPMDGKTISGKSINLPSDFKGKRSLIGVAFSKKAEENLRGWFEPVYRRLVDPPKVSFIPEDPFEGNILFVPMLKGLASSAAGKVEKEIRKGVDSKIHGYIMLYAGSLKPYKEGLGLEVKEDPYFFVLDENGTIVYTTDGSYSESKMEEIVENLNY